MNLSGSTALQLVRKYPCLLDTCRLFVLHDDLSLPATAFRGQLGGSAKGHNGVRDIVAKLKTNNFHRWRIGIGRPEDAGFPKTTVADWCLSPITRNEMEACASDGKVTKAAWEYLMGLAHPRPASGE